MVTENQKNGTKIDEVIKMISHQIYRHKKVGTVITVLDQEPKGFKVQIRDGTRKELFLKEEEVSDWELVDSFGNVTLYLVGNECVGDIDTALEKIKIAFTLAENNNETEPSELTIKRRTGKAMNIGSYVCLRCGAIHKIQHKIYRPSGEEVSVCGKCEKDILRDFRGVY